ncbi:hypothetical protein [Sphingosinithalassobacter sp. LHW66-3]|uniref:hypothetical protein n=1 Tax=Sphingosinithalassobacter sp. LHW66-3 TaxID=3424718 RepID=UPI003D6A0EFF
MNRKEKVTYFRLEIGAARAKDGLGAGTFNQVVEIRALAQSMSCEPLQSGGHGTRIARSKAARAAGSTRIRDR